MCDVARSEEQEIAESLINEGLYDRRYRITAKNKRHMCAPSYRAYGRRKCFVVKWFGIMYRVQWMISHVHPPNILLASFLPQQSMRLSYKYDFWIDLFYEVFIVFMTHKSFSAVSNYFHVYIYVCGYELMRFHKPPEIIYNYSEKV